MTNLKKVTGRAYAVRGVNIPEIKKVTKAMEIEAGDGLNRSINWFICKSVSYCLKNKIEFEK